MYHATCSVALLLALFAPIARAQYLPNTFQSAGYAVATEQRDGPQAPCRPTCRELPWRDAVVVTDRAAGQNNPVLAVAGGVVGGALGAYAGAMIGRGASDRCSGDLNCLPGIIAGFFLGETIGVATGVHLGNGGRGKWGNDFAASLVLGVAGALVGAGVGAATGDAGGLLLAVAIQVGGTVAVELHGGRRARDGSK